MLLFGVGRSVLVLGLWFGVLGSVLWALLWAFLCGHCGEGGTGRGEFLFYVETFAAVDNDYNSYRCKKPIVVVINSRMPLRRTCAYDACHYGSFPK